MERTISGMIGKGSVNHNKRTFKAKNVDKERSKNNVEFCHTDIKVVYHQLFDDALKRYNEKQKRSDRKIDNYYEKIRQGKQEKLFHEVIFQIGNKDDTNVKSNEGQLAKKVLSEFMEQFQLKNPNLHVFSAHLHMDEETPHLHIDFVPFICNSKRGLDTRVTLKGALREQGFKGGSKGETEWNQWIEAQKKELSKTMEKYNIKWKKLETHNKHLSVLDYQKQMRMQEVTAIEKKKSELEVLISHDVQRLNSLEMSVIRQTQELEILAKKDEKLKANIEQMAELKQIIKNTTEFYDESDKWQLPPPDRFMSSKKYWETRAQPFVELLKYVVKGMTMKHTQLLKEINQLKEIVKTQKIKIDILENKAIRRESKIIQLEENEIEYKWIKRFLGKEKVDYILKQREKIKFPKIFSQETNKNIEKDDIER